MGSHRVGHDWSDLAAAVAAIIHLSKPPECTTPRVNVNLNSELWVIIMCQCGLPWWLSGWRIHLQGGRFGFDPWVGKIPWRRAWQPTPVFLPGESPWKKDPGGLQSMGLQIVVTTERLSTTQCVNAGSSILTNVSLVGGTDNERLWMSRGTRYTGNSTFHTILLQT